jgi:hypothetical protein
MEAVPARLPMRTFTPLSTQLHFLFHFRIAVLIGILSSLSLDRMYRSARKECSERENRVVSASMAVAWHWCRCWPSHSFRGVWGFVSALLWSWVNGLMVRPLLDTNTILSQIFVR